jgi:hypothetical protein
MTAENLARHRTDPNIDFWQQLKEGSDRFEATGAPCMITGATAAILYGQPNHAARISCTPSSASSAFSSNSGDANTGPFLTPLSFPRYPTIDYTPLLDFFPLPMPLVRLTAQDTDETRIAAR